MRNCQISVDGDEIVIRVNAGKAARDAATPSSTGKTRILATTAGAQPVDGLDDVKVAMNVTIPRL